MVLLDSGNDLKMLYFLFQLNIEPNHTTLAGHSYEHDIVMSSA